MSLNLDEKQKSFLMSHSTNGRLLGAGEFSLKSIFFYQDSIQSGEDPKNSVKLQENVSFEDWLAVHVVDFMNRVQLFYSLVDENCTEDSCPKMSGGQKYEYLWQDGIKYKVFCKDKNQVMIKFLQN